MKKYSFRSYDSHEARQFYMGDEAFTELLANLEGASRLEASLTMDRRSMDNVVKTLKYYKECVERLLHCLEEEVKNEQADL